MPETLEPCRVRDGALGSDHTYGLAGCFIVTGPMGRELCIVSSGPDDGTGWEHVSISLENRPPNWAEMCRVKELFWGEEETVFQFHPRRSEYVNCHAFTLHLWKPISIIIPLPPSILVGPK